MKGRFAIFAGIAGAWRGPACAEHPAECPVARAASSNTILPLPQVAKAIAAKKLDILVVGAGSSLLPGAERRSGTPIRRGCSMRSPQALPGIAVKVTTDVQARRTAAEMVKTLAAGFRGGQARADGLADRHRGCHAVDRSRPIQRRRSIKASTLPVPPALMWCCSTPNTVRARNR